MALTRKFLSALGIEADKIDEIIESHMESVTALKAQNANAEEKEKDLQKTKKELEETKNSLEKVQKELEEAKANTSTEELEKVKKEFESYKAGIEKKEADAKIEKAYRELLKEIGVSEKRIDSILKVTDLSEVKLDEEGKIEDVEKKTESIKNEWADFIEQNGKKGADVETPPKGNGGNGTSGRAAELAKKYHENRFGSTKEE